MWINKYKKFYSLLRTYFKRHTVFRRVDGSLCTDNGTERERGSVHYAAKCCLLFIIIVASESDGELLIMFHLCI